MKRIALVAVLVASQAYADTVDVPALVKVIETQPADVDKAAWKEKRREAARKLAQSRDKRAVPELIKLAEGEAFDIIGEIAIEGLGNAGDPSAVPTLQKIANDGAREKAQRDLAKKALAKLGSSAAAPAPAAPAPPANAAPAPASKPDAALAATDGDAAATAAPPPDVAAGSTSSLLGGGAPATIPAGPPLDDDTLAASERFTLAAGTANLGYDSVRERVDFDADIAGAYAKRVEREKLAWGWDASAHVVAGYIDPDGRAVTRGAQVTANADAEVRFYSGALYGVGKAAGAAQLNYVADVDAQNPDNDIRDTRFAADLQVAIGGGYGRLLDVGAAVRVRRLGRTLDAARALGKPIDAQTAKRLQLAWWGLRRERSTYKALVATVAILREAGILLGEPDAGLAFEILNVLRDTQLFQRPSGLDLQLAIGEGYLQRPDDVNAQEKGRVEQAMLSAGYGAQLDEDKLEVSGTGYARLRLFAPDDQPSPWAIGAAARVRRFAYGEHGDPIGALDLTATLEGSDDDLDNSKVGARIGAELGWTWWLNQASGLRVAGSIAEDRGSIFFGASLQATYGFLDGTFAR